MDILECDRPMRKFRCFIAVLFLFACTIAVRAQELTLRAAPIVSGADLIGTYSEFLTHKTLAVVANQASTVGEKHLVDSLLSMGADVKYIMCPEHGFRGDAEAGAKIKDGVDAATGIPIISLYGNNKKPRPEQLEGVDAVVFDLQDVGCRFYTYISTLHYVMEYCAENLIPLLVLDRPNPNAGYVDGPVLEEKYKSFVGMHPGVPVVYGMTIGEYALMINGEGWLSGGQPCMLTVCRMRNYAHDSVYRLPVPPSPNLRTPQAIALYPSLCLFEGTNVSVGRGTPWPFEVLGRPSYKAKAFSFVPQPIPGVSDNPPHRGKRCYGIDLRKETPPASFDLRYLKEMYDNSDKSTFFLKSNFFDKLAGTAALRQQLQQGLSVQEIRASWQPGLDKFKQIREKYLLYK